VNAPLAIGLKTGVSLTESFMREFDKQVDLPIKLKRYLLTYMSGIVKSQPRSIYGADIIDGVLDVLEILSTADYDHPGLW